MRRVRRLLADTPLGQPYPLRIVRLSLGITLQPARMIAEIPLAIFSAALRLAPAGRAALIGFNLETYLGAGRQNRHLADSVAARMANERPFARRAGCRPNDTVANGVVMFRACCALALFRW